MSWSSGAYEYHLGTGGILGELPRDRLPRDLIVLQSLSMPINSGLIFSFAVFVLVYGREQRPL
jgi:hypothetical protein